jgi:hypothetical protein
MPAKAGIQYSATSVTIIGACVYWIIRLRESFAEVTRNDSLW